VSGKRERDDGQGECDQRRSGHVDGGTDHRRPSGRMSRPVWSGMDTNAARLSIPFSFSARCATFDAGGGLHTPRRSRCSSVENGHLQPNGAL
jgi:hypothetical protein